MQRLETGFAEFMVNSAGNDHLKSEYLIPVFVGQLLEREKVKVRVLKTDTAWCGITYKEDILEVKYRFREMIRQKKYKIGLFSYL